MLRAPLAFNLGYFLCGKNWNFIDVTQREVKGICHDIDYHQI